MLPPCSATTSPAASGTSAPTPWSRARHRRRAARGSAACSSAAGAGRPMLKSLLIRDIVLVDRLELGFAPGLSVLTGETGAGKSIILDALGLALGGRGDRGLVRSGVEQGSVVAEFELPGSGPWRALLDENALPSEGELILRRAVTADGRSRAFVNDAAVSGALLRQLGDLLVEVHGQFDQRGLLNPQSHRVILDAFGGLNDLAAMV